MSVDRQHLPMSSATTKIVSESAGTATSTGWIRSGFLPKDRIDLPVVVDPYQEAAIAGNYGDQPRVR